MSGFETLPPDQRAVLQLILVQGRGYDELATTLRLDVGAVRERAHAGAAALDVPGGPALDADTRGRVVDYLLGQQDDGERLVTFATLGDSPAACRWAQGLREQLAPVARGELPEVPAAAAVAVTNGSVAHAAVATAPQPAAPGASAPAVAPPAPPAPPA
ncbi:MAG TPA: sigma factor-like helix-turn-helix DNA-binding protein, partial [Conexibacter sp.]|nr:sigma factor-like helix-turn-helix DNA-binding protein [Conexibacter sp.]